MACLTKSLSIVSFAPLISSLLFFVLTVPGSAPNAGVPRKSPVNSILLPCSSSKQTEIKPRNDKEDRERMNWAGRGPNAKEGVTALEGFGGPGVSVMCGVTGGAGKVETSSLLLPGLLVGR